MVKLLCWVLSSAGAALAFDLALGRACGAGLGRDLGSACPPDWFRFL